MTDAWDYLRAAGTLLGSAAVAYVAGRAGAKREPVEAPKSVPAPIQERQSALPTERQASIPDRPDSVRVLEDEVSSLKRTVAELMADKEARKATEAAERAQTAREALKDALRDFTTELRKTSIMRTGDEAKRGSGS